MVRQDGPGDPRADTIYARSSGAGRAAIAIVRISGPRARGALAALGAGDVRPRRAELRALRDPRENHLIDTALVFWFPGPHSFSGEDMAELHVHGGMAVTACLLDSLGALPGLRPAEPGEITRRAFGNGKLDLTEVEGLADLIDAQTQAQRRQAVRQVSGGLRALYERWIADLTKIQALLEAGIDFADEGDVGQTTFEEARERLARARDEIARHLQGARRGERMREGVVVVIAGAPNAGKSSLLNALVERDLAIVAPSPGTTRDVIEAHLDLGGVPVVLADTAGLREGEGEGEVEAEGVRRARERMKNADLVLWLVDGAAAAGTVADPNLCDAARHLVVVNKADLFAAGCAGPAADHVISAKTGQGLDGLLDDLRRHAETLAGDGREMVPTRHRYRVHLEACAGHIDQALGGLAGDSELVAEDVRLAVRALGRITGRVDVDDVLDRIFGDFCIGK